MRISLQAIRSWSDRYQEEEKAVNGLIIKTGRFMEVGSRLLFLCIQG